MTIRKLGQMLLAFTLTLMLAACAGSAKQESTGEYIDDTVLTSRVKSALLNDPNVSGLSINVETFKGVVQLSGFVNSQADINKAVEITREVPGVKCPVLSR